MADDAEVCGCNGVCKGTIVKAIKDKGLFTLDEVRRHTKASSSCGSCTGLVEQILMATAGGDYSAAPKQKAMCGCTDRTHQEVRDAIRAAASDRSPRRCAFSNGARPNGCATAGRRSTTTSLDLAEGSEGRSAVALHQRARARQHPEGRHVLRHPAHVGRRDERQRSCAASPTSSTSTRSRRSRSPAVSASTCSA